MTVRHSTCMIVSAIEIVDGASCLTAIPTLDTLRSRDVTRPAGGVMDLLKWHNKWEARRLKPLDACSVTVLHNVKVLGTPRKPPSAWRHQHVTIKHVTVLGITMPAQLMTA